MLKNPGFTLIEVLITLSISIIFLSFGVFSYKTIQENALSKQLSNKLLNAISIAKSEAIVRQTETLICQSDNQKSCGGEWRDGFIIKAEDKIIYTFLNKQNQHHLYWRSFPNYLPELEFFPSGLPKFQNGTFWFCLKDSKQPEWAVVMSQTGRVRIINKSEMENDEKSLKC